MTLAIVSTAKQSKFLERNLSIPLTLRKVLDQPLNISQSRVQHICAFSPTQSKLRHVDFQNDLLHPSTILDHPLCRKGADSRSHVRRERDVERIDGYKREEDVDAHER